MPELLGTSVWSILTFLAGLITTVVTIYVTMKIGLHNLQKDVEQIKEDVVFQKSRDVEHDLKFAEMNGELNMLKLEQRNLREYAINGIDELKEAINSLRDLFIKKFN